MATLFRKLFPTPHVLTMDAGGVEISGRSVKYFRFEDRDGRREIASFGVVELPDGALKDGDICDPAALARALATVRARCGFSFVHASLPEQKGYLFDVAVPRDASLSLSDRVVLTLPEHVPLSPAESVFDCQSIRAESDEATSSVVVTVFPETVALAYVDALTAGGFFPLSFELEPQAAARAVLLGTPMHSACLLVDFGANKTILSIVHNGAVRFTTSTEGTMSIDAALAQGAKAKVALVKSARGKNAKEAEPSAQDTGPVRDEDVERLKDEEGLSPGSSVADMILPAALALATEMKRVLVYWQSRGPLLSDEEGRPAGDTIGREKIESAILYGGNANVRGLTDYLSSAVGIPCELADLRSALGGETTVPALPKDRSFQYATVIGLAMRANDAII